MTQNLWRGSEEFRVNLDLLITQATVPLIVDEFTNFKTYVPIFLPQYVLSHKLPPG